MYRHYAGQVRRRIEDGEDQNGSIAAGNRVWSKKISTAYLQKLELGIYNHIPGDGREVCVCLPTTVKVRATSGRSITNTDISSFINNLPLLRVASSFSTRNASGSTSQAAYIAESVEAGARVLLMDEDTCAANLMNRDHRMQQLVPRSQEPITAFIDRVRQLYQELGVSTVLVMGGFRRLP